MTFSIVWTESADRALQRVEPAKQRARIVKALETFARTGHGDVRKLQSRDDEVRLRCGNYRLVFRVSSAEREFTVLSVFHRQDGY